MTLQELLNIKVTIDDHDASGHNSETLDVTGNTLVPEPKMNRPPNPPTCAHGKTMHQECGACGRGRMVA